ncbi:MAG: hypothetical protein Q7S29_03625 [Candidatus Peribacter sp.]|nr:hypothetical protein [Candidatus Peribacter sp.]
MALAPLYLRGNYLEPLPEHRTEVERLLMAGYLITQRERQEQEETERGVHMTSDFIRERIKGTLCAFKAPTAQTILGMADIGCKDAYPTGNLLLKVWLHCPEDVEQPQKTHTVIIDDLLLPARYVRTRHDEK